MAKAERQTWTWWFDQPPEQLWPLLSDTPCFNEAMGLPKYQVEEIPRPDGTMLRIGRGTLGRYQLEWEEAPYEWASPHGFTQARRVPPGPLPKNRAPPGLTPPRRGAPGGRPHANG